MHLCFCHFCHFFPQTCSFGKPQLVWLEASPSSRRALLNAVCVCHAIFPLQYARTESIREGLSIMARTRTQWLVGTPQGRRRWMQIVRRSRTGNGPKGPVTSVGSSVTVGPRFRSSRIGWYEDHPCAIAQELWVRSAFRGCCWYRLEIDINMCFQPSNS